MTRLRGGCKGNIGALIMPLAGAFLMAFFLNGRGFLRLYGGGEGNRRRFLLGFPCIIRD